MGVKLIGRGGAVNMQMETFEVIVGIAKKHGWTPGGTLPPPFWEDAEKWRGSYFSNDGQLVEDNDALAFGWALKRAFKKSKYGYMGAPRTLIREMVDLCLDGSFIIG